MNIADRLSAYYPFDEAVLAAVSETADRHNSLTISELAAAHGLENGPQVVWPSGACKPTEILDFSVNPGSDLYGPDSGTLVHTSHGSSLTEQNIGRMVTFGVALNAMREYDSAPTGRIVAVGGASAPGLRVGRMTWDQALYTAFSNNLGHAVAPGLSYLKDTNVSVIDLAGYSAAADKGTVTGIYAADYGIRVKDAVFVASAALMVRWLYQLAIDFDSTKHHQKEYIDQSEWPDYIRACNFDSYYEDFKYRARLLRLTNVANAMVLSRDGFGRRTHEFMRQQTEANLTIGWGTLDELDAKRMAPGVAARAMAEFNTAERPDRVQGMALEDMYHAGMENPYLFTAMMLQGLRNGARARLRAQSYAAPIRTAEIPAAPRSTVMDLVA